MSHNHLLSDEEIMNRGITFVGKGKAEEEEEDEERIQEDEILIHQERNGVHNNDDDSDASQALLLEKKLQEQKSIRRARQISAKQAQQLNQHSRQAHAVPLESNITRTKHHTSGGGGGTQKSYRMTMNGQKSQYRHSRNCGEKMTDWIDSHNASYTHTLENAAVSDTVNLNGLSDAYFSSASINNIHSPTNQLRAFRRSLVISDLQGLGKTILADAAYCQQQLCEKPTTLSQAISNHETPPPPEHDCEGLDINSYLSAFKEVYTILCLCTPWELDGISSTQRDTFVKQLDEFDDQFTALKLKFIQESDPKRGTTLRCNYRITIQELSDSLLAFADFIRKLHEDIVSATSTAKKSWLPSFGKKT